MCWSVYIFLGDDFLLIEVDVEHDFLVSDVTVIVLVIIECGKDGVVLLGILHKTIFLLVLVGAVEDDVVLALESVLIALHVAN
jgi:hypothetical protein